MKKLAYYVGILVCTGIFFSSCIKEDLSDCPVNGIVPTFRLVPYEGNNIINDSLYSGKVSVFDELDRFVASYYIEGRPELNKIYTPEWRLPPGKYTYTVWLNHHENIQVGSLHIGSSTRSQTLIQLLIPETKVIENTSSIPFLCFGDLANAKLDSATTLITIPVKQLTNRINLRVTGLNNLASLRESAADSDEYVFSITDNNGIYGFDGEFVLHDPFTYSATKRADSDVLNISLTVLKLSGSKQTPTLSIKNKATGEQLFPENLTNNLIQLILASNPYNDFDKTHVYNIAIDFDPEKEISVAITINGWELDQSNPELNIN